MTKVAGIIFLFLLFYGLGAGITSLFKLKSKTFLEDVLVKFSIGAGVLVPVMFLLALARVPVHWSVYLVLSFAGIAVSILRDEHPTWWERSDWYLVGAIIITGLLAGLMISGANSYPYLEDDDSWDHATGTLYVQHEHKILQDPDNAWAHYLAPYPPFYDGLMGLIAQFTHDIPWTLKNVNGLLVGLMLLPAFLFFRRLTGEDTAALIMIAILAMLPSFASHFIWAQTYALFIMFIAFYALSVALTEKRWFWPSAILLAAAMFTQPSSAFKIGLLIVFFWLALIVHAFANGKKWWNETTKRVFFIGLIVIGLNLIYWGIMFGMYGGQVAANIGFTYSPETGIGLPDTSGGVTYTWSDFWSAPKSSKIDQATGVGQVLVLLVLAGLLLTILKWNAIKKREWMLIALFWLVLSVIYIHGNRYPVHLLFVHRYWPWLGLAIAMVATIAIMVLLSSTKSIPVKIGILIVLGVLIWMTSASAKIAVQTAQWPPGVHWTTMQELQGYVAMSERIAPGSTVYAVCKHDKAVVGSGMYSPLWDPGVAAFRARNVTITGNELVTFMSAYGYQYVTIDTSCPITYGTNETQQLLTSIGQTGRFLPEIQQDGFILLRLQ